jgi:PIN domain nuclease of toxin-antitoxin system
MPMPEPALLLDTHCWIWMQLGLSGRFAAASLRTIERAARAGELGVSMISVWEVGMLEAKGRLELLMSCADWVRAALATPGLSLVPMSTEIALESSRLPGSYPGDPADRILIATARVTGAKLMTKDGKMLDYSRQGHARIVAA